MKNFIFLLFICLVVSVNLKAQDSIPETPTVKPGKYAIGINAGFPGVGIDFARKINDRFMLRLQGNYLKFALNNYASNFNGENLLIDAKINLFNTDLLLDIHPFKTSSFKFVLGAGYFFNQMISSSFKFAGETININDVAVTSDEVGMIGLTNQWGSFAPYGGIGFGRAVPNKKIGFGIDIGSYYLGEPKPQISATGMLTDTKSQEKQLAANMSEYRWLPVFKFRISIKL